MSALTSSSWLWSCIWQSTLFLGLGGLLSLLWHHRPARSHRILLLSILACLVTPVMSEAVRHFGWGLLGSKQMAYSVGTSPLPTIAPGPPASEFAAPVATPTLEPTSSLSPVLAGASVESPGPRRIQFSWPMLLIGFWVALSALALLRLGFSLLQEVILLRKALPLHDETILWTLDRAIDRLNLRVNPAVCVSGRINSPVICCWGTQPTLVVPQIRPSADTPEAWFGILCHELGHWKRKDHWAFLASELLGCWLPWHPLVWWVRQRLDRLSELACDDWVLACGQPAQIYAESLLNLLPQRRAVWALPAVSLRTKLERRIHNIMAERPRNPLVGCKWAWSSLGITVLIAAVAAFAQSASVFGFDASKPAERQADYCTPSGMTLRLVAKGYASDFTSCPSPDGRYVCFPNNRLDEWHVRDQSTGNERLLVKDSSGMSFGGKISPDSKSLVYSWAEMTDPNFGPKVLRLIGLDGGTPRVVYTNPESMWISPVQWSGDGQAVLISVKTTEDNQAISVNVAAATGRLLRSFGRHSPGLALSPDSRYLAYDRPQEKDSSNSDLFLWDTRENQEIPLVTHPANERLLGWSLGGKWILFSSDRSGSVDLWMVPINNGRRLDSPKFVQRGIGNIIPKGFLADGSFYYTVEYRMGDVYTAAVDFEKGELIQSPSPLPYMGMKNGPEWSHDGRFLAAVSFSSTDFDSKPRSLTIFDWETKQVKTIVLENIKWSLVAHSASIRWVPGDHAILACATAQGGKGNICRIEIPSGKTTALSPEVRAVLFDITPDAKSLVYWQRRPAAPSPCLVLQSIESGETRLLYSEPGQHRTLVISPDGREVAFAVDDPNGNARYIKVISLEGGEPRQVHHHSGKGEVVWVEWHPEGRSILFLLIGEDAQATLWQVPAQGGSARQIGGPFRGMDHLRVHPDGRRIAFASVMILQHETWAMEHFLPQ